MYGNFSRSPWLRHSGKEAPQQASMLYAGYKDPPQNFSKFFKNYNYVFILSSVWLNTMAEIISKYHSHREKANVKVKMSFDICCFSVIVKDRWEGVSQK